MVSIWSKRMHRNIHLTKNKFRLCYTDSMKTILVDAINGLILEDGTIFGEMYNMLETYKNPKIVLTGANDEQWDKFNLDASPMKFLH